MPLSLVATAAFASSLVVTLPTAAPDLLLLAPDRTAAAARADERPLNAPTLEALTAETSVRFATDYFVGRLLEDPDAQAAHETIAASAAALRRDPDAPAIWSAVPDGWTALFVPGSETGALGAEGLAKHRLAFADAGFTVEVLSADGALDDAARARQVGDRVAALSSDGARVLLVSAGDGSVVVSAPASTERVQLIAAPQRSDLPPRLRKDHRRLSPRGPNDGVTLLADQLAAGALVVPVAGATHAELAPHTLAAAALLLDRVADEPPGGAVSFAGGATTTP